MRKLGKHYLSDNAGFKISEQMNQVGGPVSYVAWPPVIQIGKLTEEVPIPIWGIRAHLQRAFDAFQENPQCILSLHEAHPVAGQSQLR